MISTMSEHAIPANPQSTVVGPAAASLDDHFRPAKSGERAETRFQNSLLGIVLYELRSWRLTG
jgi:hypothetical protein